MASHQKFKAKIEIPFTLLSDPTGTVCESYQVLKEKNLYGKKRLGIERSTFLIDEDGIVTDIFRRVKVDGHIEALLAKL
jgi:peroxiredoxin Q/BCP